MADKVSYPHVRSEEETLDAVLGGKSIARYGDGEFKIIFGASCVSQKYSKALAEEMAYILRAESSRCLVGIPNLDPRSPKIHLWRKYEKRYPTRLNRAKTYYSSFITRPDSAPWIYTPEFYAKVTSLWRDKDVTLVSGTERSLTPEFVASTGGLNTSVFHISCERRDAYEQIDLIEKEIRKAGRTTVLLCCGPAATCLAWRLHQHFHAIDLGHIGMFWYEPGVSWHTGRIVRAQNSDYNLTP